MTDRTDAARPAGPSPGRRMPRRVFLSHTSDLYVLPRRRSFVAAAQAAVTRAGDAAVDMAFFTARDAEPSDYSARMVEHADVYVGIIGHRYGTPVRGRPEQSYTELEFETATALGLPRLVFLLAERDRLRLPAALLADDDPALGARQAAFRRRLIEEAGLTVAFVTTPYELETRLFQSLVELAAEKPGPPAPRELPADVYAFTGRRGELGALDALEAAGRSGSPVVISAVSGTAGVGKTALAVHWARRAAERFPDGQLYLDLHGYHPDEPLVPAEALARLLRSLGVAGSDIPPDPAERAARFRTLVAGRRMLLLLDNARGSEQVSALLPGDASCFVVVTSRDQLGSLVARHGARRIDLDRMPPPDAVHLLRTLVGPRVDAEAGAAAELAERCALLPLALRIAAELAATRPERSLADLVAELADERRRLDVLDLGDDRRTAVRAVFGWSYRQLPAAAARLFRLLGLYPGRDIAAAAAAALAGTDPEEAAQLTGVLLRAHLVESTGPGRVAMHELLRAYARERAGAETEVERRAALTRLFDYYVEATAAAARAWLDAERPNLVAAAAYMAHHGWTRHVGQLSDTLERYLDTGAYYAEALALHRDALRAAQESGDDGFAASALSGLGVANWRLGRHGEALDHLQRALVLRRQMGDGDGEARVLARTGYVYLQLGRYDKAVGQFQEVLGIRRGGTDPAAVANALGTLGVGLYWSAEYTAALACLQEALELRTARGERLSEAYVLGNMGAVHWRLGQYQKAIDVSERALAILREVGDRVAEAGVMGNLGMVRLRQGLTEEALTYLLGTLDILQEVGGDPVVQAEALDGLGLILQRLGRHEAAIEHHRRALAIARRVGNRRFEATFRNSLAETLRAAGRADEARAEHDAALAIALDTGDRLERARSLDGIARLLAASGELHEARERWRETLTIYADLGVPEADEVRRRLNPA